MIESIIPKEITLDIDNGKHIASFSYYDGIDYAHQKGMIQNTFNISFDQFVVCCGDVMVQVKQTDYPEIKRREI